MDKNKELAKNTLIITIGRISTQFISFFLLPLYTALLSTEEYGTVDLVNTYAQLLLPMVIFQMDQALLRFMILEREKKGNYRKSISTTYIFFAVQIVFFGAIYFITTKFIENKYAIYLFANIVAMGISGLALQTARGFGDNITYSISSFLSGALTVIFNVLFIAGLHMKAEGMLIAAIIGNLTGSAYVVFKDKLLSYLSIGEFDRGLLYKMLRYAWPLIPNALIWWIVNASDRSVVLFYLGASANGILAVSHKFPTLITTVYNIFHLSWTESAALHLGESDRDRFFSGVFDSVFRFFSAASSLLIAIMPFVFSFFINESYREAYYQIPIYTLASFFNVIVGLYSVVYIAQMKTAEIAKTSLFSGVINIIIDLALIKSIGLYAASISSAVAFGAMALYRAIDIRKYIQQKIDFKILAATFVCLLMGFGSYYSESIVIKAVFLVVAIAYSTIINRNNALKIILMVKSRINNSREVSKQ